MRLFKPVQNFVCPSCKKPISKKGIYVHTDCVDYEGLDGIFTCYEYNDAAQYLMSQYKYKGSYALSQDIADLIMPFFANMQFPLDVVTYVPLHPSKQKQRGFNQVELVLKRLSPKSKGLLQRMKNTKTQAALDKLERVQNVFGAFATFSDPNLADIRARELHPVRRHSAIIMDDVYTTGSTLANCAKALKDDGFQKVYGFTWFR